MAIDGSGRSKQFIDADVLTMARERMRYLFDQFDKIHISFSGGKDSTVVLNLALEVARERGQLPLSVHFIDEEAIHPPTIEYVQRCYDNPEIDMKWWCLPISHRNACSDAEPWWLTFDPDKRDLWVRDPPPHGIMDHELFVKGDDAASFLSRIIANTNECMLLGIRTQESLRRYRVCVKKKNDNYIFRIDNSFRAYPIYDMGSEDVWICTRQLGWDYNKTYDVYERTKLNGKYLTQRVCPPFGEEPLRGLWLYAECFPELWHKMLNRVEGVATAWRYSNTELYCATEKPENLTWKQYVSVKVQNYKQPERDDVKKRINGLIELHRKATAMPIEDDTPNPLTGISWKFIAKLAVKGDFKGRQVQTIADVKKKAQDALGITEQEALNLYGRPAHRQNKMAKPRRAKGK